MSKVEELARSLCGKVTIPLQHIIKDLNSPPDVYAKAVMSMDIVKNLEIELNKEKTTSKWKQTSLPLE